MAVVTDPKTLASIAKECVSGRPTTLELTLISIAALCSVAMKLIQSSRDRTHSNAGQQTILMILIIILSPVISSSTAMVALVLGWTRTISIDALAAALFALIPGILSLPLDSFHDTMLRLKLRSKSKLFESLRASEVSFQYFKIGHPCKIPDSLQLEKNNRLTNCRENQKDMFHVYVACFPPKHSWLQRPTRLFRMLRSKCLPRRCGKEENSTEPNTVCFINCLNGKAGHGPLVKQLENVTVYFTGRGFHYRVFRSVMSALWLTQQPWRVFLDDSEQVLHAFVLLLDILMIGNLVLVFHKKYILDCKSEKGTSWQCASGSASLIKRQLIKELKIIDWLPETLAVDKHDEGCQAFCDKEDLLFLFFLLIEKSEKFRGRKAIKHVSEANTKDAHRTYRSGRSVLREAQSLECDRREFFERLKGMVDEWLISWGCDTSVRDENDGLRLLMEVD